jgi:hypothetical protein
MSDADIYNALMDIKQDIGGLSASVSGIDRKLDRACDSITQHDKSIIRHENDIHLLKDADNTHRVTLARIERILTKDMVPLVQDVKAIKARTIAPLPKAPPSLAYSPPDASVWQRLPTYGKVLIVVIAAIAGVVAGILTFISGVV